MKTLPQLLGTVVGSHPDRTAIVEGERALSYAEMGSAVGRRAGWLLEQGVKTHDSVGLLLANGADFAISYFAILAAGGVVVPLNDQYGSEELQRFLSSSGARILMTSGDFAGPAGEAAEALDLSTLLVEDQPSGVSLDWVDFDNGLDADSPAMNQFSSGSTGAPKRIARSHGNVLFELDSFHETLGTGPADRFIGVAPFSHVNGLMRSMVACLTCGGSLFPLPRFDRRAVAGLVEREQISVFIAVPFMFGMLAKTPFRGQPDFSSLRLCVSASAPMPEAMNRDFHAQFGVWVRQLYGSTETGTISVNLDEDPSSTLASVGHPIRGVEIEVVNEGGAPVAHGELGELAVRSPAAVSEYVEAPEATRESFREGYFLTGDLGRRNREGHYFLEGRKKFFINKGGYKINPAEIEGLLESHPSVEEAVVVGVPTSMGDERVQAVVVRADQCTAADLVQHCEGRIAPFKVPSQFEFRQELPKSPTGKVRRQLLIDGL